MEWKKKKKQFSWFRLGLLSLIGYFVYVCVGQQYQLYIAHREAAVVQRQQEQAQKTRQELLEERGRLNDAKYIEKLAREQLGLVKAGEVPFISSSDAPKK